MSKPPTAGINRLSLTERMPDNPDASRRQSGPSPDSQSDSDDEAPRAGRESVGSESDNDSDKSDNDEENDKPTTIESPTRLKYDIRNLPDQLQDAARERFDDLLREPGHLAVQWCQVLANAQGEPQRYAFQLQEVVRHSVRIGPGGSTDPEATCSCAESRPCRHLLFLYDQITKQTLYDHDPDEPLVLNEAGFAEETGSPFSQVAKLHLAVLASGLGCDAWATDQDAAPSPARIQRARDVVSYFSHHEDYDEDGLGEYIDSAKWPRRDLIHRDNLDISLFNLLVEDPNLAAWVRSLLDPTERPFDPYTQLERRVERIIQELEASDDEDDENGLPTEQPRDTEWAANHITRTGVAIRRTLIRSSSPPEPWERASAARAIIRTLRMVVSNNRLYFRLIGDANEHGFPLDVLELLVDQSQWREELEDISNEMGALGLRPAYKRRMDGIVARLRSSASSRRASGAASVSGGSASGSGAGPSTFGSGRRAASRSRASHSSTAGSKRQGQHETGHDRSGKRPRPNLS